MIEVVDGTVLQKLLAAEVADPTSDADDIAKRLGPPTVLALGTTFSGLKKKLLTGAVTAALFENCFVPAGLPSTPTDFVAPLNGWANAAYASLALLNALDLTPASYASENSGHLFQHLTKQPGRHENARKSRDRLKGHTDAVYHLLPDEQRISSCSVSPDFVVLIGLRNLNKIATRVISVASLLKNYLKPYQVVGLQQPRFDVSPQRSFSLPRSTVEHGVPVLVHNSERGWFVRYSNNSIVADDIDYQDTLAEITRVLAAEPPGLVERVVVSPGSVLFLNNRVSLHGRDKPESGPEGGLSRWIIRTYGVYGGSSPQVRDPLRPWVLAP